MRAGAAMGSCKHTFPLCGSFCQGGGCPKVPWQVECDSKSAQGIFHPPQNVFQFRGTKLPRQFRAAVLGDETAAAVSGRQFRGMKLPRQSRAAVLPRQFRAAFSWDETAAAVS